MTNSRYRPLRHRPIRHRCCVAVILGWLPLLGWLAVCNQGATAADGVQVPTEEPVAQAFESIGSLPWYDPEGAHVAPVDVEPQIDDSVNRQSRWLPQPATNSTAPPVSPSSAAGSNSYAEIIGWVVVCGLMMVVVSLLVYAFLRIEGSEHSSARRVADEEEREQDFKSRLENLPIDVRRPKGDLLQEADRLAIEGRLDEAIIYLFGHRLLQLDRHHIIRLARGKTNRQYLSELHGWTDLRMIMRETIDVFEASYFGRHAVTPQRFETIRDGQPHFESLLASLREAA